MATVGISRNRIYTDAPAAPVPEPFEVRPRLTKLELLALAAVIGVCFSVIGFEYGYRRPARAAAEAVVQARQTASRPAPPAHATTAPAKQDVTTMTVPPATSAAQASTTDTAAAAVASHPAPASMPATVASELRAEQAQLQRMNNCAALLGEQAQILRRSGDVTVLAQVHASDRVRAREIEASMQRLRCNG